jgi:hypothetical protein
MYEIDKRLPLLLLVLVAGLLTPRCQAQTTTPTTADLDSQIESVRSDLRADKVAIITDTMKFTPQESSAFWPIYRKYEADLTQLNDERVNLIKQYSDKYMTLTDADAKQMAVQSFELESRRADLKKRYFKAFNQQISGVTCAKFFQLEHRLDLLVDLKIASELPALLIKPSVSTAGTSNP